MTQISKFSILMPPSTALKENGPVTIGTEVCHGYKVLTIDRKDFASFIRSAHRAAERFGIDLSE